jgi:homopolymeric O-antigen transport system permease protein
MDPGRLPPTYTISPERNHHSYWPDLWRYRSLVVRLARKDILLRHRQTVIGLGWVVARPLMTAAVLVLVFGRLANLSSEGVPYPVFVFAALVPWQLATVAVTSVASSVVANSNLIGKVYFPRLIIPLSSLGPGLIDFVVSAALFAGVAAWYGVDVRLPLLLCPWFVLVTLALSVGVGLWMAGLSARFRDVMHGLPFVMQFGLYVSPVGYGTHLVPDRYKPLYVLNPMAGIIDGFRWTVLGIDPYWPAIYFSSALSLFVLATGVWFFRRQERTFADVI